MPFLISVLVSIGVMAGLIAMGLEYSSTVYRLYKTRQEKVHLEKLREDLEEFYKDNAMAVNSSVVNGVDLRAETVSTRNGSQPSGKILLPNGTVLRSYLGGKPVSINSTTERGLLYFESRENLLDRNGVPFRIYITPLQEDPQGRFAYRDIYIVDGEGRTAPVASYPSCEITSSGYYSCRFVCAPDETCVKVDGYRITLELYKKTEKQLESMARQVQVYAQQLYAQDPQKDVLRDYLSHESTRGQNDLNCSPGTVDCYYSHLSEIRNTTLYGTSNRTESFNGYSVTWLAPNGARLGYASSIPFLTETVTPFHARIYYDNSSSLVRTPENTSNHAGYTMLFYTPVDDQHGIRYEFGE